MQRFYIYTYIYTHTYIYICVYIYMYIYMYILYICIYNIYLYKIYIFLYILLYFRFWGTCEEHARLLHRYVHGNVVCCLPPHHLYLAFLPMLSLPNSPPPAVPPLVPPHRPQCVMLPSLCPCVLIVQHLPLSENMWCSILCYCVRLLRMMVSRFIHVPTKDTNSSFFMAA